MQNIIISMTSYPKRIQYVSLCIENFLNNQTIIPDMFYLWLSIEDFPKKENNLPTTLLNTIKNYNINLQWTQDNLYSFKRFLVYPLHYKDYCMFIDDDVFYSPFAIKNCLNTLKKYPNTICNIWKQFTAIPIYNKIKRLGWNTNLLFEKNIKYWMCGNCMIPPLVFPLQSLNYLNIFKEYACGNDELFLIPFILNKNIEISFNNIYYQFKELTGTQINSIHNSVNELINNEYHKYDLILFNILKNTNLLNNFQKIFTTY